MRFGTAVFRPESRFSAADLAFFLDKSLVSEKSLWLAGILKEACRHHGPEAPLADIESLGLSRILHTVGTAVRELSGRQPAIMRSVMTQTEKALRRKEKAWLGSLGLSLGSEGSGRAWGNRARQAAFEHLGMAIVLSGHERVEPPKNALREDEIVWGRAPARLDLGGGWTDTPPYSLERGGCVINAAVNLNGQAPIQAYARVIPDPEIRINSIDHSVRIVIRELRDLLDYRQPASRFGLAKAALALCGFSPADMLEPRSNGGLTLLYYTGLRRLAKNILADVVGSYLSRDRSSMRILQELNTFPPTIAKAMSQKSVERFGRLIDAAWGLKKGLDPESTTPVIEGILNRIAAHIFGATLLGAGRGGFLLLVCRSRDDAEVVRRTLCQDPPNERARFFEFGINQEGLVVTVC